MRVGDRVVISRVPTPMEDPDGVWGGYNELVGCSGVILGEEKFPLSRDSIYAMVDIDGWCDLYIPVAVLRVDEECEEDDDGEY